MIKKGFMIKKCAVWERNISLVYVVSNYSGCIRLRVTISIILRRCVTHGFIGAIFLRVKVLSYCLRYNNCVLFLHFLIRICDVSLAVGIIVIQIISYLLAGRHRKNIWCIAESGVKEIFNVHHIDVRTKPWRRPHTYEVLIVLKLFKHLRDILELFQTAYSWI